MEVAGHWRRRQWAGTAEYGKVTEGGVTRQVARAMEVVHASAPGARVRVMRAAYHASAAKGAPAASFLMHSSHSVISSGFNLLETPTFSSKPLEISSTPLESSPERNTDTENYKVTEPDDYEISAPSKWKSSTGRSAIRNSSEESSSTDNASIIDLDARHKNLIRKYSYDSENSDIPIFKRNTARMSPLLDEPVALSTLKYKSLLSGNNDWNNRRKSYSFENTNASDILHSEDNLMMESSTDSGICKSTELIVDSDEKLNDPKRSIDKKCDSFKAWLSENRLGSIPNGNKYKESKGHDSIVDKFRANLALHSAKQASVTVPMTVAADYQPKIVTEEESRKLKKVGFSKTELHFTPDTGIVNIINTDNKPPPSQDFRRRRTELLPLLYEKPVTLLYNSKEFEKNKHNLTDKYSVSITEESECEEITAATKSILKNKIPKPKPYLLGENMEFGNSEDFALPKAKTFIYDTPATPAPLRVTQMNKQLHELGNHETKSGFTASIDSSNDEFWANSSSPLSSMKQKKLLFESSNPALKKKEFQKKIDRTVYSVPLSPGATTAKTRQLRDSDLTYFGIKNYSKTTKDASKKDDKAENSGAHDYFHSVRLVQKVSAASDSSDTPEYQNVPIKTNFAPVPTPRPRSKFNSTHCSPKDNDNAMKESRRSRTLTQIESVHSNRSISAPPKIKPETSIQTHESTRPRRHRSPECIRRSPECIRRSPERARQSPEKSRRCSPKRVRRSPDERTCPSPDRARHSPEKSRRCSPERARRSPEHKENKVHSEKKRPDVDIKKENEPTYVNYSLKPKREDIHLQRTNDHKLENKKEADKTASLIQRIRTFENRNQDNISHLGNKTVNIRTEKLATPDYTGDKDKTKSIHRNLTEKSPDSRRKHPNKSSESHKKVNSELIKGEIKNCTIAAENGGTKRDEKCVTRLSPTPRKVMELNKQRPNIKHTTKLENTEGNRFTKTDKIGDYSSPQRSKYIINYDDKNGTVSSVCKVKPDNSSIKKKPTKEKNREAPKEHKSKLKAEKIALLQSADNQWHPYDLNYADRKWKRKMHVQRTCQLL